MLSLGLLAAVTSAPARGESLWARRDVGKAFLFYDTLARHVGDTLTVVISENTDVQNQERRAMSKDTASDRQFQLDSETGGDLGMSAANADFSMDSSTNRSFDGNATFQSEQEFVTNVTVSVVDVLPNGYLVVAGRRQVFVSGDRRMLAISGVVRPYDISPSNTIASRFISNLQMSYDSEGPEQRYTRRGWLSRVIDRVWPN
jgi:flagellar L-ring protein precursor FlgH